jgi:hypothetical protein
MKSTAEMGSGATIHIPSFIKINSKIQKLMEAEWITNTETASCSPRLTFIFSKYGKQTKLTSFVYKHHLQGAHTWPAEYTDHNCGHAYKNTTECDKTQHA